MFTAWTLRLQQRQAQAKASVVGQMAVEGQGKAGFRDEERQCFRTRKPAFPCGLTLSSSVEEDRMSAACTRRSMFLAIDETVI